MNTHTFETFRIRSDLLKKIKNINNELLNNNYYYITNLKDFVDYYLNNNLCNISNNNLLNNLKQNMNAWNTNIININNIIMSDMGNFIYNYDSTDNEMNDLMIKLAQII